MALDVKWLGHATFRLSDGETIVYIDPYELAAPDEADIVLITHEHYDHCSPEDVNMVVGPETAVLAPADCRSKLAGLGGVFIAVEPGVQYEAAGLTIKTVPAYNVNKQYHPRGKRWVGYIVGIGGKTVYHAGDTDFIPEMKGLAVDVALLPVGGTYTMTADEAAQAARAIGAAEAVPMHYGSIVGSEADAQRFRSLLGK